MADNYTLRKQKLSNSSLIGVTGALIVSVLGYGCANAEHNHGDKYADKNHEHPTLHTSSTNPSADARFKVHEPEFITSATSWARKLEQGYVLSLTKLLDQSLVQTERAQNEGIVGVVYKLKKSDKPDELVPEDKLKEALAISVLAGREFLGKDFKAYLSLEGCMSDRSREEAVDIVKYGFADLKKGEEVTGKRFEVAKKGTKTTTLYEDGLILVVDIQEDKLKGLYRVNDPATGQKTGLAKFVADSKLPVANLQPELNVDIFPDSEKLLRTVAEIYKGALEKTGKNGVDEKLKKFMDSTRRSTGYNVILDIRNPDAIKEILSMFNGGELTTTEFGQLGVKEIEPRSLDDKLEPITPTFGEEGTDKRKEADFWVEFRLDDKKEVKGEFKQKPKK